MVITSEELVRDLQTIDRLIPVLSAYEGAADEDVQDLSFLKEKRRHLARLLEARRRQRGKKVVDLGIWRTGRSDA
jgi:hypothetical protein